MMKMLKEAAMTEWLAAETTAEAMAELEFDILTEMTTLFQMHSSSMTISGVISN